MAYINGKKIINKIIYHTNGLPGVNDDENGLTINRDDNEIKVQGTDNTIKVEGNDTFIDLTNKQGQVEFIGETNLTGIVAPNLTAENIVKDVNILGVTGTYEGGGGGNTLKALLDFRKNTTSLFSGCTTMTYEELNELIKYNDTENVTSFYHMFSSCTNLTTIPQFNTSKVTDMGNMFNGCQKLTTIPLLDTSKVTTMYQMFYDCRALTTIPQLDTSNVTNMESMFYMSNYNPNTLTTIPQLDTSKVTNMKSMFYSCKNLTEIPQLNTSNVTNMRNMFEYCEALTTIPLLDTSKVTDMYSMFNSCNNLTEIPQLNTSNVTTMRQTFYRCRNLTKVPQLDTSKVTDMYSMFENCAYLPKIDISHFNIKNTSYTNNWCMYCYSLKALIIRSFGSNYVLNSNAFSSCCRILGTSASPTFGTFNPDKLKDGYIYVPRDMIETLSSATNWSTHASQLRALEDYTKDGTTTGEFDDEKAGL